MNIKSVFESAINGTFDLTDMLGKINTHHIAGNLTDIDREELIRKAREKADPFGGVDVMAKLQELEERVRTLEEAKATGGEMVLPAVLIAMAVGTVLGMFNGLLVAKLNIPAIVVTLGSMNIMRGGIYFLTDGAWVEGLSGAFTKLASNRVILNIPLAVWFWLLAAIVTYVLLYRTRMGRNILAVGGNVVAAERVGISKTKTLLFAFGYLGALTGLAGAVSAAKLRTAQPSNGLGYEMDLIAGVIIGGTQFTGGICSILGTVLGVILLGVIKNGLVLAKVPVYWQDLATGVIIIIAVASSGLRELKPNKKNKKEAAKG